MLRVEVTAAMVRSLGETGVDRVLSEGREELIKIVARRVQAGLDASHSGLELSSLELTHLAPPQALASDFDAVQSAFIGAQTQQSEARAYAESTIPAARADTEAALQTARGDAGSVLAVAKGDTDAFRALDAQYRSNPAVVRERLYRDAVEHAIGAAGAVQWVPPPTGAGYHGFRIRLAPDPAPGRGEEGEEP
jgi:membrane protease subunit HflK